MSTRVPFVDYLVLDDDKPHLVANECEKCGARFFDHRDACASCFNETFTKVEISPKGTLKTFTIVSFAGKGIPVPYVGGVIDCDGTSVKANVINVEPLPENIKFGMPLRLATFSMGTDDDGVEAFGFGFEPDTAANGAN